MSEAQEYFDPITGGVIPGGYAPDDMGNYVSTSGDLKSRIRPGGIYELQIGDAYKDAAAKQGFNVGDWIGFNDPRRASIIPDMKQEGFGDLLRNQIIPTFGAAVLSAALPAAGSSAFLDESAGLNTAAQSAVSAPAAATAATAGSNALSAADLAGPLASPESVGQFLSTVPEAVPGTTLDFGGLPLDITAPGTADMARAAISASQAGTPGVSGASLDNALPTSQSTEPGTGTVPDTAEVPPPGDAGVGAIGADATLGGTAPITPVDTAGAPGAIPTDVSAPAGTGGDSGMSFSSGGGGGLTPFSSPASTDIGPDFGGDTVLKFPDLEKAVGVDKAGEGVFGGLTAKKAMDLLLKGGPLALGVAGAINAKSAGQKAASDIRQIGAPQRAAGEALVNQFNSGQLSAADSKAIDDWEKGATAQMKQFFANAKISDSTQAVQSLNDIQAKAAAMRSQALLNTLNTGLQALGVTDQYQLQAIQAELSGDKEATASAMNFLNSYGSWLRALPVLTGEQPTKAA